jgi:hypothetical protein
VSWRRRSTFVALVGSVLLSLSLEGCALTFDASNLGVPVTLATAAGQRVEGSRFRVTSRALYGFWGLVKLKDPSLRKALAAQLGGASGIANLRIKVSSKWSDVLFTTLTAGLIVPRAVTFEGIVTGSQASAQ